MIDPGARVLDIGCGDGALARLSRSAQESRRPRHGAEPIGRQLLCRPRAFGHSGRRRSRSRSLPDRRLRRRGAEPDPCRRRDSRARCSRPSSASAGAPSSRSRISASGEFACTCCSAVGCRCRISSLIRGTKPPTSISARSATSLRCATTSVSVSSAASPSTVTGNPILSIRMGAWRICSLSRAYSSCPESREGADAAAVPSVRRT